MEETTINNNPQLPPNPTKFYTHFLYKAILVSIFLLLLPLFPSQAPDFINNKTINATSWEFLQLVFVGIAVSYGLFSKRNDETRKEDGPFKPDNVQSYVARLLQVSSVFDDDSDNHPSASGSHDKVQTWNSQYYRGEPIVVVAKDSDDAATIEKPLLLPVRSLKTRGSESPVMDSKSNSVSKSNWRRVSRNLSRLSSEETEENVVLRSPIPWRSRSGRMEVKEDFYQTPSVHHDSADITNTTESPSFRYQSSRPGLNPSSEDRIHPSSPTLSSEIQSIEEEGRRKSTQKSAFSQIPPPPPPPPPPQSHHRPVNVNQFYNGSNTTYATGKDLKRNMRSVPEEIEKRSRRWSEFAIRSESDASLRSRRKDSELDEYYLSHDSEIERFIERKGSQRKKLMDEDMEYPKAKEEKKELIESSVEEEVGSGSMKNEDMVVGSDNVGPDVDKKADEFIAKFREQIRLQRIASIRKSTTQNGTR